MEKISTTPILRGLNRIFLLWEMKEHLKKGEKAEKQQTKSYKHPRRNKTICFYS